MARGDHRNLYCHSPFSAFQPHARAIKLKKKKKKKTLIVVFSNHPGPNGLERNPLYSVTSAPAAFAEEQLSIRNALHPSPAGKAQSPEGTAPSATLQSPSPGSVSLPGRGTTICCTSFGGSGATLAIQKVVPQILPPAGLEKCNPY